jgi:lipopolysaccharide export system permease protein
MRKRPNVRQYVVAFHYHLTFPLANVVLLLLALPFALRFERGSKIERVFFAVIICAAFLVVDLICRRLGNGGFLHPLTAAWLPTVLFGSMAVAFYDTVRT